MPALEQVAHVAHEGRSLGADAGGANDETDFLGKEELVEDLLQALALLGVADLSADAPGRVARHHHEIAAGNGEVGRHPRALRGDGALGDLDDDFGAGLELLVDLLVRELLGLAAALAVLALAVLALAVLALAVLAALLVVPVVDLVEEGVEVGLHVPVVEEGVLLESDVDEGGLQVVLQVLDAALEDAADEPLVLGVLDHELLEPAVLHHRDARLELLDVDDDLAPDLVSSEPACDLADDCLDD